MAVVVVVVSRTQFTLVSAVLPKIVTATILFFDISQLNSDRCFLTVALRLNSR